MHWEIDTGASLTIQPKRIYRLHLRHLTLVSSTIRLRTYTGQDIRVLGQVMVIVEHAIQEVRLHLVIVRHAGPALLGRNWLNKLPISWSPVHAVTGASYLGKFAYLFD